MSKSPRQQINVMINTWVGPGPILLTLAHRQLEKSRPGPIQGQPGSYTIPLDLVRMAVGAELAKGIKTMSITYRRKS